MIRKLATVAGLAGLLPLLACNVPGPSLAGQPGLQWQVQSFYDGRAMERHATCPNPSMQTISRTEIVEDTPERVVMRLRYYWFDDSQDDTFGEHSVVRCQDWAERTFTFDRRSDGTLQVVGMSGVTKDNG